MLKVKIQGQKLEDLCLWAGKTKLQGKKCRGERRELSYNVREFDRIYTSISLFEDLLSASESVNECSSSVKKKINLLCHELI